MVCGNFILPEPASYVFFYAFSNLRNLLYIISDMRLSRSTVKRALTDLEQHGYLQKIPRYRDNGSSTSNLYSVQ